MNFIHSSQSSIKTLFNAFIYSMYPSFYRIFIHTPKTTHVLVVVRIHISGVPELIRMGCLQERREGGKDEIVPKY